MSRFHTAKTNPDNHSGLAATTEHHVVKRILAALLAATCMMGASAANVLPTVSISNPSNNASYPAPGVITLKANAADADGIAKVEYYFGTTYIGKGTLAPPHTYVWGGVPIRDGYRVTAKATDTLGGVTTSAVVLISVKPNVPPTAAITSPANNAIFAAPGTILLQATANDSEGQLLNVKFFNGDILLRTDDVAPYSFNWTNVSAGVYTVNVRATDTKGIVGPAASISVTVTPGVEPAAQVFYIYSDQVNTAREISNAAGVKVWQADPEPFGANLPNENPTGQGQFTYNQRFPGQYYDRETGLHYNYFRDYDPQTGRYIQSDPIGLAGGINTYGYVGGNPLGAIDPMGLSWRDNIRNAFHDWPTLALTHHYVYGAGRPVFLTRMACSKYTGDRKIKPRIDWMRGQLDSNGGANVANRSVNYVTNIFAMGNGVDNISANCKNGSCVITVSRVDYYTDPEDKYQIERSGKSDFSKEANQHGTPFAFGLECDIPYTPPKKEKECP